jgi:hypothetical protein
MARSQLYSKDYIAEVSYSDEFWEKDQFFGMGSAELNQLLDSHIYWRTRDNYNLTIDSARETVIGLLPPLLSQHIDKVFKAKGLFVFELNNANVALPIKKELTTKAVNGERMNILFWNGH